MNSIFLLSNGNFSIKEVHFNLWMVNDKNNFFIDIGLKVKKGQKLTLLLPWENAILDDLFDTIKKRDVLNAIFNQHLEISKDEDESYLTVSRNNEKFDIVRACFYKKNVTIENTTDNNNFTKIIIEANPQAKNIDIAYVRFRAKGFKDDIFNHNTTINGPGLSPYKETIEAIDFRVNELRTVKQSNFEEKGGTFTIPKIEVLHFFLIKNYREISSLSSPNFDRCRQLEDMAWHKYLPAEDKAWHKYLPLIKSKAKGKLAYHWKKNRIEEGEHFSVLTIFKKKQNKYSTILIYIALIIVFNIFSNHLYNNCSMLNLF